MGRNHKKKVGKGIGKVTVILVFLLCLGVVYISFASYFENHFLPKTFINGRDVSFKTVEEVEKLISEKVKTYKLEVEDNAGDKDTIEGKTIGLQYKPDNQVDKLMKKQRNSEWIFKMNSVKKYDVKVDVAFSRDRLDAEVKKTQLIEDNSEKAKSAKIELENGKFVIVPESEGKEVSIVRFEEEAYKAVSSLQKKLNLSESNCYAKPEFTSKSPEVVDACNEMNKYLDTVITYNVAPKSVQIDRNQIQNWISVDAEMKVHISGEKILEYVKDTLKKKIDTVGTERTITAPNGRTHKIVGVNYGWKIDPEKEKNQIIEDIKGMKPVEREPIYDYRAESHKAEDFGDTYVEVSISDQKLWMIKDGAVAVESDVVTGNPNNGNDTDKGIFIIQNRLKNTVLRGPKKNGRYEWESPVKYWMQFTRQGQGFHDASWQGSFGGQRYKQGFGSRGCVNMPLEKAGELYELTHTGMPVIIHD